MTKYSAKRFMEYVSGNEKDFELEQRFFNMVTFVGTIIGLFTVAINLAIAMGVTLTLASTTISLVCGTAYYLSRYSGRYLLSRWITTISAFGLFAYIFFINNGSWGPVLYLYMAFMLLIIFIWNGWERVFFIGLFYVNLAVFMFVEMKHPGVIMPYADNNTRLLDIYLSYTIYAVLLILIMSFIKRGYIRARQRAEESDQLKSSFLANMSHEIRTPMNAIIGFTQLLQTDLPKEKKDFYISVIRENGQSLLRLIDDIIDVSKIEAGEIELREMDCNLDGIFRELVATFRQMLDKHKEKKIDLVIESGPVDLLIKSDPTRIKQVISNLIHNAIKYTDEGYIRIGCQMDGEMVRVFVRDTGCGIKPEDHAVIFDRFRKIETDRSLKVQTGTGIGLSISKNLVELLGGEIGLVSTVGKGSEFYFTIPYIPVQRRDSIYPLNDQLVAGGKKKVNLGTMKILIAEDNPTNLYLLNKVLENTGIQVISASTGREAIQLFNEHTDIDVVLMDIMMPDMNGFEATRQLKHIRPEIPVIAQTALAMEGDLAKVQEAGCDDYISKPIRMNALIDKLCEYLPERISI